MKITIEHLLDGTVVIDRPDYVDGDINDLRDKLLIPMLAGMTYAEHTIGVLFNLPELMDNVEEEAPEPKKKVNNNKKKKGIK